MPQQLPVMTAMSRLIFSPFHTEEHTMTKYSGMTALLLLCSMLVFLFTGCGAGSSNAQPPQNANAAPKADLSDPLNACLDSWVLEATAESPTDPATIWFAAVPAAYQDGQTAELVVTLNGETEVTVPCQWDGSTYNTFLTLTPQDGYGYYFQIAEADGTPVLIPLSTPEEPVKPALTYLASSMTAFCNLHVEKWSADNGIISIESGSIQVQLPQITLDTKAVSCDSVVLLTRLNDEDIGSLSLSLTEGDTIGSYFAELNDLQLRVPEIQKDDQLNLLLEVPLSNGETLSAQGGSWFFNGTGLELMAG